MVLPTAAGAGRRTRSDAGVVGGRSLAEGERSLAPEEAEGGGARTPLHWAEEEAGERTPQAAGGDARNFLAEGGILPAEEARIPHEEGIEVVHSCCCARSES